MTKRKAILIIIALTIIASPFLLLKLNKNILLLWNVNHIYVTADEPLNKEKVKIAFGVGAKRYNEDFYTYRNNYTIFYNGTLINKLMNYYGENDFLITYDDKYYMTFRHFKSNRRHQHDYHFHFIRQQNKINVTVDINGINDTHFESELIEIVNPENN
jgi:hypothetical protein